MSAYRLDGGEIFEEENPAYIELIKEEADKKSEMHGNKDEGPEKHYWLPKDWNKN
ncbi:hypothetical protein [Pedobacter sp. KBS0701]|uniref:hypothetical protein n=1 Tax=Pedobacter sp. KBS0701 TaxID=2578106 RepID=UPI00143DB4DA|nr:hypothetical protein [Pedobacter sp. KBS0701]